MKKALALFKKVDYTEISGRTPTQTSEKLQNIKIKNVANTISGEVPQTNILTIYSKLTRFEIGQLGVFARV